LVQPFGLKNCLGKRKSFGIRIILLSMKNVLIDKNIEYIAEDEYRELLKGFDSKFVVGKDLKQRSFDENRDFDAQTFFEVW